MAIYFDQILDGNSVSALHLATEWHQAYPVLAVASYSTHGGGFISIYNDDSTLTSKMAIPGEGRATQVTCLSWHPHRKILAVSCEGGDVYTWNDYEHELLSSVSQHGCSVSLLHWSPCGTRLITADENGALVGWRIGAKGSLDVAFHHELKDPLTHLVFKSSTSSKGSLDIEGLARAAVSGDEDALDLFSSLHMPNNTGNRLDLSDTAASFVFAFYIGSSSGIIYFVSADGSCSEVAPPCLPIQYLLYHSAKNLLIVVDESPAVIQYNANTDGSLEEISKIKLSGKMSDVDAIWAGNGVLALAIGELAVRMWDIDSGDNYILVLDGKNLRSNVEHIQSLAYNKQTGVLTAGTNLGNIQMWSKVQTHDTGSKQDLEKCWKHHSACAVKGAIKHLRWNLHGKILAVNTTSSIHLLTAHVAACSFNKKVAAVQLSANQLVVESYVTNKRVELQVEIQIHGIFVTPSNLAVWSGQKVFVYEIENESWRVKQVGGFPCETKSVAVHEQNVYVIESGKIQVRTFQGTVKQSLGFLETEGEITHIDVCGPFLVGGTSKGVLKMWEISRREAKPYTNPKVLSQDIQKLTQISSIRVNCIGTKVSILFHKDSRIVVWDVEADNILVHLPKDDRISESGNLGENNNNSSEENQIFPVSQFWDLEEPRLLSSEVITVSPILSKSAGYQPQASAISLFVTSEHGILVQDVISIQPKIHAKLLGVRIPHYYFLKQTAKASSEKSAQDELLLDKVTMKDFVGLDDNDSATKDAMMSFSFFLTVGNMDEAFKAIKKIKSAKVWESMARMCVKTKRLDVALVCLGQMGCARGAKALRESMSSTTELDAKVAALAVHLGMLDEAEQLYKSSGRHDLLNKFYQASNHWKKAIEVAANHDRIHLRTTHYNYAKYLESKGETVEAVAHYEKSETHRFEVPRMLFDDLPALDSFLKQTTDKTLLKWWAQYMESTGEMETALQYYEKAKDYLALVRVYCYCNNLSKAAELANETGDRAACYHLGRQYENNGDIKEAVHFFTRAQAYSNAIRICKEQCMEDQLLNLALMGGKSEMVEVAAYYETRPDQVDKAVMLYHKGGLVLKAVDLAFKSNQRHALEQLAYGLDERTDPKVLHRCATYFMENGQPDRAVDLLAKSKEYLGSVNLCAEHNVVITEALAETLTPPKDAMDAASRNQLLERIAECCYRQENYHLATKKFTQAGNKEKAMKSLLKSGDTERIVFFANVSRQREIYVMGANYLQTLDWRTQPEIMRNIVAFYTKGKALDLLAGFYDMCARVEIDEYQNYEKAVGALSEAYKCMNSASLKSASQKEEKLSALRTKLELVKKFVLIRRLYEEDQVEAMKECQVLLKETDIDTGVRTGDVLGFMIEHYARQRNYRMAYNLIEEMKLRVSNVNLSYYIDGTTLESIHRNLEIPYDNRKLIINGNDHTFISKNGTFRDGSDEEVEEDVHPDVT